MGKFNLLSIVVGMFIGGGLIAAAFTLTNRVRPAAIHIEPPAPTATPEPTATPSPVHVFVNGAVAVPDVYELAPGSLVQDAVRQAGGFTTEANQMVVNLAQPLMDGMQIYVPTLAEETAAAAVITNPVGGSQSSASSAAANPGPSSGGLVNINTATADELDTLPGVGPSTAQSIITFRDENGPFAAIENIMDVPGIGEAKFNSMRDLITVGG